MKEPDMDKFRFDQNGAEFINGEPRRNKPSNRANSPEELIDFARVASLLSRHKWVILFFLLVSVSTTYYLVNYYLLPRYSSQATVLISSTQNALPASDSEIGRIISSSFNMDAGGSSIQSSIYLFESRELSNEVAKQIIELRKQPDGELYPILWSNFPEDSTSVSPDQVAIRIRRGLVVEPLEPGSQLLKVSYESYSPYEAARIVNFAVNAFQDISLENKRESARSALQFLGDKKVKLRSELNQAEERMSRFMNERELVGLESQASNLVNSLSNLEAEQQALSIQLESVNSAIGNYEKQIESIKPGLADRYSRAVGPTISSYQQRLAELMTQRFVLISNNPRLKENPNSEPELRRLNQQISELQDEIQSLSKEMLGDNENYIGVLGDDGGNVTRELANLQGRLTELRIQKNQLEAQISALDQRIKESKVFLDRVPENQVQLARLEREVEMNKELFNTIAQQEAEVTLWEQTQSSSGTIVDHATINEIPVKPQKILWFAGGIILGLFLPIGFIFVRDFFANEISSIEQLKRYPYPLFSVTYDHSLLKNSGGLFNKKDDKSNKSAVSPNVIMHHDPVSPIAESYRRLVSNLLYTDPDKPVKSILVTSSGPGEGKTTLTGNLGGAFAELDKRVLIIDCDFRRPGSNKLFGLRLSPGITEIIFEENKISESIRETEIPNLFLLPAGKKPVRPAKLTGSEKFTDLVNVMKSNYDIILFDTPPYGIVSDITPIIRMADTLIVTAKFGETTEPVLEHTLEDLDKGFTNNIGLVLTMYKPKKSYDSYETKGLHHYKYQEYYDYERVTERR